MKMSFVNGSDEGGEEKSILAARVDHAHPMPQNLTSPSRPRAAGDGPIAADGAHITLRSVVVPGHTWVIHKSRNPVPTKGDALLEMHEVREGDVVR